MISPPQAPAFGPLSGMPAMLNLGLQAMWIGGPDSFTPPSQILDFEIRTFLLWNGLHLFDWMVLFCFFVLHPACVWYALWSLDSRSTCALYTPYQYIYCHRSSRMKRILISPLVSGTGPQEHRSCCCLHVRKEILNIIR